MTELENALKEKLVAAKREIKNLEEQAKIIADLNRDFIDAGVKLLGLPPLGGNGQYCVGALLEGIEKLQARIPSEEVKIMVTHWGTNSAGGWDVELHKPFRKTILAADQEKEDAVVIAEQWGKALGVEVTVEKRPGEES